MVANYTTGELKELEYIAETVYGTTPVTALAWGSDLYEIKETSDMGATPTYVGGSRAFTDTVYGPKSIGLQTKGICYAGTGFQSFYALHSLGTTTGVLDHLPSFTAQFLLKQIVGAVTTYNFHFFNGCKMDKLEIAAEAPGKPIMFNADIKAQWVQTLTNTTGAKAIVGLQSITVGADSTAPTKNTVTWSGVSQVGLAGGAMGNWNLTTWKLAINNNLEGMPGNKTGADAALYPLANLSLEEGKREIDFDFTLPASGQTYIDAMRAGSAVVVTLPIDGKIVTLSGGKFVANDFGNYKQAVNTETHKVRFNVISIA